MNTKNFGKYSKSIITDIPADINSKSYTYFEKIIPKFHNQAVYIYSLVEGKMIYTSGWYELLGYKDDEISLLTILSITAKEHTNFSNELNDKALKFLFSKSENLEEYSFTLEVKKIHKNGDKIPLLSRIGVYKATNGTLEQIIGVSQVSKTLQSGKIMQYAAYGPDKSEFEETLNKELFNYSAISKKEKEALLLSAQGLTFKEIAEHLNVSQSAIEKRILPLYKRFGVKSLPHLVSFAYENHILP